jgi:hypothetical protein
MESLVHLGDWNKGDVIVDFIDNLREVSGTIQLATTDCTRVTLYNFFNSIHSRVKDVSIQGKAMAGSVRVGWN